MQRSTGLILVAALLALLCLGACSLGSCSTADPATTGVGEAASVPVSGDDVLAQAFAAHASGLEVQGQGTVIRLLADDTAGERHQRFIVELASGQTLLVAHNIDVAPRVEGLRVGDGISFKGEYEWNAQGGVVHWTHHDPDARHVGGWIEYEGEKYR